VPYTGEGQSVGRKT
jgi:DNA mismatch repair protein MutH